MMEEETRQSKQIPWSMEFTVPGQFLGSLKKNLSRVKELFKVETKFTSTFEREDVKMQWINIFGENATADDMNNAKSYITAMANPEVCISIENFAASVFKACRDQVEKDTCAFLQLKENAVIIKGSELAVVLAQSMLESFQDDDIAEDSENTVLMQYDDTLGESSQRLTNLSPSSIPTASSNSSSLKVKAPISSAKSSSQTSSTTSSLIKPCTSGHKSPSTDSDLTYVKTVAKKSQTDKNLSSAMKKKRKAKSGSNSNSAPNFASTFKSSGIDTDFNFLLDSSDAATADNSSSSVALQYDYLKNIGLTHRYDMDVIVEGLNRFDMGDIVKPVEFLEVLNNISQRKDKNVAGTSIGNGDSVSKSSYPSTSKTVEKKQSATALSPPRASKSNASIILIEDSDVDDTDDDDDDDSRAKGSDAIVISSDEEKGFSGNLLPKGKWQNNNKKKGTGKTKNNAGQPTSASQSVPSLPSTQRVPSLLSTQRVPSLPPSLPRTQLSSFPSPSAKQRKLRYIVIDGSNVAMGHGIDNVYSVPGIAICINYFLKRGHMVTAFVPETRRYANNKVPIAGKPLLEKLNKEGTLKFTPARRLQSGKTIVSYDDRFILNLADAEDGIVVSNDYYRDLINSKPSYRNIIETRLLPFTFVGDHFMPPDDPLGKDGPTLDQFLSHGVVNPDYIPLPKTFGRSPFRNGQPNFFNAVVGQGPHPPAKRRRLSMMGHSPCQASAMKIAQDAKRRARNIQKRKRRGRKRYFKPTNQQQ